MCSILKLRQTQGIKKSIILMIFTGNRYDGSPDWKHDKFHEVQDNRDEEMFENYWKAFMGKQIVNKTLKEVDQLSKK